MQFLKTSHVRQ